MDWNVEHLRFSAFSDRNLPTDWWTKITGAEPDSFTARPTAGSSIADGRLGDHMLRVQTDVNKIHLVLTPNAEPALLQPAPVFQSYEGALKEWQGAVERLLEVFDHSIFRIAIGAVGQQTVEDHRSAYKVLQKEIPFLGIDLGDARDFLLQINIPTKSTTEQAVELNRLVKWMAIKIMMLDSNPRTDGKLPCFVRTEMDFSTPAETLAPFDKATVKHLFNDLQGCVDQVFKEGGSCLLPRK